MKKIFFALFLLPILITSCSSSNSDVSPESKVSIKEDTVNLDYGTTVKLTIQGAGVDTRKCEWSSSDDFVAQCYDNIINGEHVGSAKIYVKYLNSIDSCVINVRSLNDKVYIPNINWGASKEMVKNSEKVNSLQSENENTLDYQVSHESIFIEYKFDNDKLLYSHVFVNNNNWLTIDIDEALFERFESISVSSDGSWYKTKNCYIKVKDIPGVIASEIIYAKDAETIKKYF